MNTMNDQENRVTGDDDPLRFGFGDNWSDYLKQHFSEERLTIAQRHLLGFVKLPDLRGRSFLDIGCGSGLHSLAAWRAGARPLFSFDFDAKSVATTKLLRKREGDPPDWTIVRGSVLDDAFMQTAVPTADIVYSWGVLHHTGEMWHAVRNAASRRSENGLFYIALYVSEAFTNPTPEYWMAVKREYNRASDLKRRWMVWRYGWNDSIKHQLRARRNPMRFIREYKHARGMSYWHDVRDWLGGYPMEFAGNKETEIFCREQFGLSLINKKSGEANSEFLFCREGLESAWPGERSAAPLTELRGPFIHAGGHAWQAANTLEELGDPSRLMLYEDRSPIGWPNCGVDFIATWGRGRYGLVDGRLCFSATDNTNPNTNGRRYLFRRDFI